MDNLNFKPIVKEGTARQKVYSQIKNSILNGDIDSKMYFTEVQLSKSFQISRTPIRAALQDLMKEGIITSKPGKGLKVRELSVEEQEEIFLLRASVEKIVLKKLAKEFSSEDHVRLTNIINKQKQALLNEDKVEFINLDQAFHLTLTKLANYHFISEVLYDLHNLTQLMGLKAVNRKGRMQEVIEEHTQILKALEQNDSKMACSLMLQHLDNTKKTLNIL